MLTTPSEGDEEAAIVDADAAAAATARRRAATAAAAATGLGADSGFWGEASPRQDGDSGFGDGDSTDSEDPDGRGRGSDGLPGLDENEDDDTTGSLGSMRSNSSHPLSSSATPVGTVSPTAKRVGHGFMGASVGAGGSLNLPLGMLDSLDDAAIFSLAGSLPDARNMPQPLLRALVTIVARRARAARRGLRTLAAAAETAAQSTREPARSTVDQAVASARAGLLAAPLPGASSASVSVLAPPQPSATAAGIRALFLAAGGAESDYVDMLLPEREVDAAAAAAAAAAALALSASEFGSAGVVTVPAKASATAAAANAAAAARTRIEQLLPFLVQTCNPEADVRLRGRGNKSPRRHATQAQNSVNTSPSRTATSARAPAGNSPTRRGGPSAVAAAALAVASSRSGGGLRDPLTLSISDHNSSPDAAAESEEDDPAAAMRAAGASPIAAAAANLSLITARRNSAGSMSVLGLSGALSPRASTASTASAGSNAAMPQSARTSATSGSVGAPLWPFSSFVLANSASLYDLRAASALSALTTGTRLRGALRARALHFQTERIYPSECERAILSSLPLALPLTALSDSDSDGDDDSPRTESADKPRAMHDDAYGYVQTSVSLRSMQGNLDKAKLIQLRDQRCARKQAQRRALRLALRGARALLHAYDEANEGDDADGESGSDCSSESGSEAESSAGENGTDSASVVDGELATDGTQIGKLISGTASGRHSKRGSMSATTNILLGQRRQQKLKKRLLTYAEALSAMASIIRSPLGNTAVLTFSTDVPDRELLARPDPASRPATASTLDHSGAPPLPLPATATAPAGARHTVAPLRVHLSAAAERVGRAARMLHPAPRTRPLPPRGDPLAQSLAERATASVSAGVGGAAAAATAAATAVLGPGDAARLRHALATAERQRTDSLMVSLARGRARAPAAAEAAAAAAASAGVPSGAASLLRALGGNVSSSAAEPLVLASRARQSFAETLVPMHLAPHKLSAVDFAGHDDQDTALPMESDFAIETKAMDSAHIETNTARLEAAAEAADALEAVAQAAAAGPVDDFDASTMASARAHAASPARGASLRSLALPQSHVRAPLLRTSGLRPTTVADASASPPGSPLMDIVAVPTPPPMAPASMTTNSTAAASALARLSASQSRAESRSSARQVTIPGPGVHSPPPRRPAPTLGGSPAAAPPRSTTPASMPLPLEHRPDLATARLGRRASLVSGTAAAAAAAAGDAVAASALAAAAGAAAVAAATIPISLTALSPQQAVMFTDASVREAVSAIAHAAAAAARLRRASLGISASRAPTPPLPVAPVASANTSFMARLAAAATPAPPSPKAASASAQLRMSLQAARRPSLGLALAMPLMAGGSRRPSVVLSRPPTAADEPMLEPLPRATAGLDDSVLPSLSSYPSSASAASSGSPKGAHTRSAQTPPQAPDAPCTLEMPLPTLVQICEPIHATAGDAMLVRVMQTVLETPARALQHAVRITSPASSGAVENNDEPAKFEPAKFDSADGSQLGAVQPALPSSPGAHGGMGTSLGLSASAAAAAAEPAGLVLRVDRLQRLHTLAPRALLATLRSAVDPGAAAARALAAALRPLRHGVPLPPELHELAQRAIAAEVASGGEIEVTSDTSGRSHLSGSESAAVAARAAVRRASFDAPKTSVDVRSPSSAASDSSSALVQRQRAEADAAGTLQRLINPTPVSRPGTAPVPVTGPSSSSAPPVGDDEPLNLSDVTVRTIYPSSTQDSVFVDVVLRRPSLPRALALCAAVTARLAALGEPHAVVRLSAPRAAKNEAFTALKREAVAALTDPEAAPTAAAAAAAALAAAAAAEAAASGGTAAGKASSLLTAGAAMSGASAAVVSVTHSKITTKDTWGTLGDAGRWCAQCNATHISHERLQKSIREQQRTDTADHSDGARSSESFDPTEQLPSPWVDQGAATTDTELPECACECVCHDPWVSPLELPPHLVAGGDSLDAPFRPPSPTLGAEPLPPWPRRPPPRVRAAGAAPRATAAAVAEAVTLRHQHDRALLFATIGHAPVAPAPPPLRLTSALAALSTGSAPPVTAPSRAASSLVRSQTASAAQSARGAGSRGPTHVPLTVAMQQQSRSAVPLMLPPVLAAAGPALVPVRSGPVSVAAPGTSGLRSLPVHAPHPATGAVAPTSATTATTTKPTSSAVGARPMTRSKGRDLQPMSVALAAAESASAGAGVSRPGCGGPRFLQPTGHFRDGGNAALEEAMWHARHQADAAPAPAAGVPQRRAAGPPGTAVQAAPAIVPMMSFQFGTLAAPPVGRRLQSLANAWNMQQK